MKHRAVGGNDEVGGATFDRLKYWQAAAALTTTALAPGISVIVSTDCSTVPLPTVARNDGYDAEVRLTTITDANAALAKNAYDVRIHGVPHPWPGTR